MLKIKQQTVDLFLLIFTLIIGIVSYILNVGWIRVIFFLPFLGYNTLMLITGTIYVFMNRNKWKFMFYLSLLTYILFNVFLFDGGDSGYSYCFFGLIKIDGNDSLFYSISMVSLIISLICIVFNIIVIIIANVKYYTEKYLDTKLK